MFIHVCIYVLNLDLVKLWTGLEEKNYFTVYIYMARMEILNKFSEDFKNFSPIPVITNQFTADLGIYFIMNPIISATIMILSFRTARPGQTVQTQIFLLLEEPSDQGLHCLPFRLHHLDSLLYGKAT